ncbi:MAG TPA: metal-sensing transcriptional repressor [Firmicutes bacterium]|nr:metal-sensing transcriptional repressor [Candidatus Fermentithermobacillaceae bacterium]
MKADKDITLRKLKTVRGQIEGLIRMVEDNRYCIDISNQVMASIGILKNINRDILDAHLRNCVTEAFDSDDPESKKQKINEIIMIIDKLAR